MELTNQFIETKIREALEDGLADDHFVLDETGKVGDVHRRDILFDAVLEHFETSFPGEMSEYLFVYEIDGTDAMDYFINVICSARIRRIWSVYLEIEQAYEADTKNQTV